MNEVIEEMSKIIRQLHNELYQVEIEKGENSLQYLELKEIIIKSEIYTKKYS